MSKSFGNRDVFFDDDVKTVTIASDESASKNRFRVFESRVAFDAPPLSYSVGSLCSMAASDTETWWHMSRINFSSLSSNPTLRRPKIRRHHSVLRARAGG